MTEYEVTVYTKVRETYYIEAGSIEEAERTWHEGDLLGSECEEVLDVVVEVAT